MSGVGTDGPFEAGFPGIFTRADQYAIKWQKRFLRLEFTQLAALVLAAVSSTISGQTWRVIAFVLVLIGFGAQLVRVILKADQKWWNGRALAETVKTTSWKYCVGGDPFPIARDDCDAAFVERLTQISAQFDEFAPFDVDDDPISASMRATRRRPHPERVDVYRVERIEGQQRWYSAKATSNGRMSRFWTIVAVVLQSLAVLIGAVTLLDGAWAAWAVVEFEQVGVLTSAIAAVVAWTAVKQNDSVEQAYRNAALELRVIDGEMATQAKTEDSWANFVDRAEQAISREHTSWLASQTATHLATAPRKTNT